MKQRADRPVRSVTHLCLRHYEVTFLLERSWRTRKNYRSSWDLKEDLEQLPVSDLTIPPLSVGNRTYIGDGRQLAARLLTNEEKRVITQGEKARFHAPSRAPGKANSYSASSASRYSNRGS